MRQSDRANKEGYMLLQSEHLDHSCIASKNMSSSWSSMLIFICSSCVDVDELVDINICVKFKHDVCSRR